MYDFLVDKTVDITAREYHAAVYDGSRLQPKFNTSALLIRYERMSDKSVYSVPYSINGFVLQSDPCLNPNYVEQYLE